MSLVMLNYKALHEGEKAHIDRLAQAGFTPRFPAHYPTTEDETIAVLNECVAVVAGGEPYTERVFAALPKLRVVARAGVGFDQVDCDAATRHRVAVTITPKANHEAVAEHTLALLLAVAREIVKRDRQVRQGFWAKTPYIPLRGQTLGVVGLGRIGRSVAVRAKAFGMQLLAFEVNPDREFARSVGMELVSFEDLLTRSDFVTLHVPLMPATRGLMNRARFQLMKPGSILVNTARGGLVVETDLLEALQTGRLAGAGLDVFEQEPTPTTNPLLALDNVVVSPHFGGGDVTSIAAMADDAAQYIIELSRGGWPAEAVVNPAVRDGWKW